ncbi:MAG: hypothetical protein OWU33_09320 [Firmicutes bacterium]|nr:hypothetical protein [Bacillota bacterium]
MNEEHLRLEYWEDTRSDPQFPLWVIFKFIGQAHGIADNLPYLRPSQRDLASVLKALEAHPALDAIAADVDIAPEELHATLWYLTWLVEHHPVPPRWHEWNSRLDTAWQQRLFTLSKPKESETS